MIEIFPLKLEDVDIYQLIYNHKEIIAQLGGFTHRDTLKGKIRQTGVTIWGATYDSQPAGSVMIAGRNQVHFAKFGEVGVLKKYRRNRIMTALYSAIVFQGVIEGRRLWEDTIVGNNPYQFAVLPTLNIKQVGLLPKKTASFLDIAIFALNLSINTILDLDSRIGNNIKIRIIRDYYTNDIYNKNIKIYEKKNPSFINVIRKANTQVKNLAYVTIEQGLEKPPHNVGKKYNQDKQESLL